MPYLKIKYQLPRRLFVLYGYIPSYVLSTELLVALDELLCCPLSSWAARPSALFQLFYKFCVPFPNFSDIV